MVIFCSEHGRAGGRLRADVVVADARQVTVGRPVRGHADHRGRGQLGGLAGHAGRGHRAAAGRRAARQAGPEEHNTVEHDTVGHLVDYRGRRARPVRAVRRLGTVRVRRRRPRPVGPVRGPVIGRDRRRRHFHRRAHVHRRNRRGTYRIHFIIIMRVAIFRKTQYIYRNVIGKPVGVVWGSSKCSIKNSTG